MAGLELRNVGTVKWFDSTKGYGFITDCMSGEDIFVHFSSLKVEDGTSSSYKTLIDGEYVSYTKSTMEDGKRSLAVEVTGVGGGHLMCQQKGKRVVVVASRKRGGVPTKPGTTTETNKVVNSEPTTDL